MSSVSCTPSDLCLPVLRAVRAEADVILKRTSRAVAVSLGVTRLLMLTRL